jgi:DNA-binding transcriptional regulator YhcF (GntR family)
VTGLRVDHDSAVPPYEQVRLGIAALAADGTYPAGHKLPPVRTLATDLGLAANTVARAYRELEQAGLVETRGRAGTVITARAARTPADAQTAARAYVTKTRALGITDEQALDLVRAALRD